MALIIKGDMPKACNWFDDNGKHRFCKVNAFCDCRIYTKDKRPSDCPILGEIPDEHGKLIDADKFITELRATINKVLLGSLLHNIFVNDESVKQDTLDGINFVLDRLENAPTVLEAST